MASWALTLLALPRTAAACAVCFGKAPGSEGFFRGIAISFGVLVLTTMAMLGWLAATMIRIEKRRAAADRSPR